MTGGHFFGITMAERQRRSRASRRRRIRVFSVMTPVDELVKELNAFGPTMLSAYPSALSLVTQEQEAGRSHLRPMVITAAGESLVPEVRERAEAALGSHVWNNYGVRRFQAIKTSPEKLSVRLEAEPGADTGRVWEAVEIRMRKYLAEQRLLTRLRDFGNETGMSPDRRSDLKG